VILGDNNIDKVIRGKVKGASSDVDIGLIK
jgi:hypothetical protein